MKKARIRVAYRIDYSEITPGSNYTWSSRSNESLVDSVMADWNGETDDNQTPMSKYLLDSLKDDNKEVPTNLILEMEEDDGECIIINFESDVDIDKSYLKDWLKGQFSDGFGEHEFSRTSNWIRKGTNGYNEMNDVLTITERVDFMIYPYCGPHRAPGTGEIMIYFDEVE